MLDAPVRLESVTEAERASEDEATTAIRLEASEKMSSHEVAAEEGRLTSCEALWMATVGIAVVADDTLLDCLH
jgi:hypothetical protein